MLYLIMGVSKYRQEKDRARLESNEGAEVLLKVFFICFMAQVTFILSRSMSPEKSGAIIGVSE
jgi:hypothetical protein